MFRLEISDLLAKAIHLAKLDYVVRRDTYM